MSKRWHRLWWVIVLLVVASGLSVLANPATAETARVSVDRQEYSSAAPSEPCQGNPGWICVSAAGGQIVNQAFLHFDLSRLPLGTSPTGLKLKLVPTGDAASSTNSGSTALQACLLTNAISDNFKSSDPPPAYDCKTNAAGQRAGDGSWTFNLAPLIRAWEELGYSGVAIVPATAAPPAPGLPAPPSAWSISFGKSQTAAEADYFAPLAASEDFPVISDPFFAPVIPSPVIALPLPEPPIAGPLREPVRSGSPGIEPRDVVRGIWVLVALALSLGAVAVMAFSTRHHLVGVRLGLANIGRALTAARSQAARPVAILLLAAGVALGSAGSTVLGPAGSRASSDDSVADAVAAGEAGSTEGPGGVGASGGASQTGAAGVKPGQLNPALPPLKIGFTVNNSAQKVAALLGVKLPSPGNLYAQVQTMVKWINAHGGLAGHKVVPVIIEVDTTDPNTNQWNNVCIRFTEDEHVFAVIGTTGNQDTPLACYAQHKTLFFSTDIVTMDHKTYLEFAPYTWLPHSAAEDQWMMAMIDGLEAQGYFTSSAKIGIMIQDFPAYHRIYDTQVAPKLSSLGYKEPLNLEKVYVTSSNGPGNAGQVAQEFSQTAAKFKIDDVTHVMMMYPGGGAWLLFSAAAEQQQYRPRYGYSTADQPFLQESNGAPQSQMANAIGIGSMPILDTSKEPWPNSDVEALCLNIMKSGGQTFATRQNSGGALRYCGDMWLLQKAAAPLSPNQMNGENIAAQISKLGSSLQSPLALPGGTRFVPNRPEGNYYYRHSRYDTSCSCFLYKSSQLFEDPF